MLAHKTEESLREMTKFNAALSQVLQEGPLEV
jgi:hypothetical protein